MHEAARKRLVAEIADGTRRGASRITCKRCDAPCLRGDDHDEVAAVVTVDEQPLDQLDEMLARLDGRATFDLIQARDKHAKHGRHDLHYRDEHHLDTPRVWGTVHAEHRCQEGNP